MQLQKINVTLQISSSKYYDIDEIHNVEIPNKNESLSLFRINACSHNRNFDDHQHLLSWAKNNFDKMRVTETRITKKLSLLNNFNPYNYSYEFTSTKTNAGGTLLYIIFTLSYQCFNDPDVYNKAELGLTFIEIDNPKKSNVMGVI